MNTLLIEIGCEEIPAGYIVPALEAFEKNLLGNLAKNRIDHGKSRILGTPRRLALMVEDVAVSQKAKTATLTGPPEKIGFDGGGKPTIAAEKFAQKAGITVDEILVADTGKGKYLTAVVEESCESSASILEGLLEKLILAIPFPKQMRWGSLSISFARPIISLTGILGDRVLNFSIGSVKSSNKIFGHQFMDFGPHKISLADEYEALLESVNVVPDIRKRKEILQDAIKTLARENNSQVLEDPALVDIVANLVEYPYPVVGKFDDQFLEVPDEVLITAMREHQKYFALVDDDNKLCPMFIAVNNTMARDMDLVAKGHEKVLRARLSDAKFFFEVDLESSLDEFADKLKKVTFQAKLGSVHDKCQRISLMVDYLSSAGDFKDSGALKENLARAAKICKADLVSQVVIEFTKLQGIIGRAYAKRAGENHEVAQAIEQHYRPVYSGAALPENLTAALLAIADKLDTICGCFSVDLIPTGGTDPYALRRQGIGILQIMLAENLSLSLSQMVEKGLAPFISDITQQKEVGEKINGFLKKRMINIMVDSGFSKEAVNSALAASFDNIPDVLMRVKALDALRQEPDFEPLSTTFKRVENILKKAGDISALAAVDISLFEQGAENRLHQACTEVDLKVTAFIGKGNYDDALKEIAGLRSCVDDLFEDVMVFADDDAVKNNRIALLAKVSDLFKHIADFSKI